MKRKLFSLSLKKLVKSAPKQDTSQTNFVCKWEEQKYVRTERKIIGPPCIFVTIVEECVNMNVLLAIVFTTLGMSNDKLKNSEVFP